MVIPTNLLAWICVFSHFFTNIVWLENRYTSDHIRLDQNYCTPTAVLLSNTNGKTSGPAPSQFLTYIGISVGFFNGILYPNYGIQMLPSPPYYHMILTVLFSHYLLAFGWVSYFLYPYRIKLQCITEQRWLWLTTCYLFRIYVCYLVKFLQCL